jgi:hypothetical protein
LRHRCCLDVGTYNYAAPGSLLPHAVMSTSGGTISTTFTYDANGNQTAGLGRNISYSSYNKPSSITQGTQTISFLDDTEHQRFQQVTPSGTTLYIAGFGVLAELSGAGSSTIGRHHRKAAKQQRPIDGRSSKRQPKQSSPRLSGSAEAPP